MKCVRAVIPSTALLAFLVCSVPLQEFNTFSRLHHEPLRLQMNEKVFDLMQKRATFRAFSFISTSLENFNYVLIFCMLSDGKHHYDQADKIRSEMKDLASEVRWPRANCRSFYSTKLVDFSTSTLKYITDSAIAEDSANDSDDMLNDSDEDMFDDSDETSSLPHRKRRKLSGVAVDEHVSCKFFFSD